MPGTYISPAETGFYYLQSRYYDPSLGRFINADSYAATGTSIIGYNMFAYCNNNPIGCSDSLGTRPIASTSVANESKDDRETSCDFMNYLIREKVNSSPLSPDLYPNNLSPDEKVLVATIAAEGAVTDAGEPVSRQGRQAMANVALNRYKQREWKKYDTISDICAYSGFDGYGDANYQACMNYLNNRDGSNSVYEEIIWDVMSAYENDITNGCQLYYTPAVMNPPGSAPNWDFNLLEEVIIPGVDPYYEGRFYRYK